MFLEKIVALKKQEIQQLYAQYHPMEQMNERFSHSPGRSLVEIVKQSKGVSFIAEVKPASPSRGVIREEVDPIATALSYEKGGASAISVLTEEHYFKGKAESLTQVRQQVRLPVLRKDFIMDPIQVYESKQMGADVILLIAALLDHHSLRELTELAHQLEMEVLLEVHEPSEIDAAVFANPDFIGINNRNLKTLATDLSVTERLRPMIPPPFLVIGESGVHSVEDVRRMVQAGVDGILIGEYLMRQDDSEQALQELRDLGTDHDLD
ncbi:indole-3-glycerol phosphate synthase TrpC [Hazenella coriacea]|uniref:Indole-3-glycerol phosphate synthase n=1 Tax=Hazenella coriacea TaxID=1179467 RepID=A0A4V2UUW7_9BACL|nr:indole-3-glycerol phosphate synthase TrpC [Hazenella coriacea]TCS93387.1 indole-3-glycerol phosphate synthase [Hazenella coriacea]